MADMIDAKEARNILACDDAALNGYINGGQIRAQKVGGKLMVNRDDVEKVAAQKGDEEGTIVLTGDSDELSIDLGKVVDDASETIVQSRKDSSAGATESITFGDELEVVSFDDGNTKDLNFDKTRATQPASGLNFTDSNTAVMTAVDETQVGGTTGPIDFQTDGEAPAPSSSNTSSRRSVRSNRARVESAPVHWSWMLWMTLTLLIGLFLILPYYFLSITPAGLDKKDAARNIARGLDDNGWTNMASTVAGFSVEPSKEHFAKIHTDGEFRDMKDVDAQAQWRFGQYLGELKKPGERLDSFVIESVAGEGKQAKSKTGKSYPVVDGPEISSTNGQKISEPQVNLGFPK